MISKEPNSLPPRFEHPLQKIVNDIVDFVYPLIKENCGDKSGDTLTELAKIKESLNEILGGIYK